jgi:hypothetical protein
MGTKLRSGSGMNIPDHISESLETIFVWVKILKVFVADANPVSGSGSLFYFGSGINIPEPQYCETLEYFLICQKL